MTAYFKKVSKSLPAGRQGFTLIELLIVMAILGVLAVVVLVAINPVQQLARTRDTGRKSGVTQIGHAISAYYTARNGQYPGTADWLSTLSSAGELSTQPSAIAYSVGTATNCAINVTNNWCYAMNGTGDEIVVYASLESQIELSKCTSGVPYFVYSSTDGRGGLVCSTTGEPNAGVQIWNPVQ